MKASFKKSYIILINIIKQNNSKNKYKLYLQKKFFLNIEIR